MEGQYPPCLVENSQKRGFVLVLGGLWVVRCKTHPDRHVLHVWEEGQGEGGSKHIEHAQTGVFYVFEGKGGGASEHVEYTQTAVFYVFEGKGKVEEPANA